MLKTLKLSLWIVLRNWTVYRKDLFANMSPTIADPAFILIGLGLGLGPFVQQINGKSYAQFLAAGLIATTALLTSFFECSYGFFVRMTYENVFKAMLTTPIGVREIIIGEFIWVFLKGFFLALGVATVLRLAGLMINPYAIFFVPFIAGLLTLPCGAVGLVASGYVRNINQFQAIYSIVISPLYFLSGVFFPIEGMPPLFQKLVNISPFFHGIRLMQMAMWGTATLSAVIFHVVALLLFFAVIGAWASVKISRKLVT